MFKISRFAPSPTGYLHVGNIRTAIFNYMVTRQNNGKFILRLDDTDKIRSKQNFIDQIKYDLDWLGLEWDQVIKQSNRIELYDEVASNLKKLGRLYECFETKEELDLKRKKQLNSGKPPVYDRSSFFLSKNIKDELRSQRKSYWRFLLDHDKVQWQDGILGSISIDTKSVSDPVLIRADGQYLYTLASVKDDLDLNISNVIRGIDHVTNTAVQIQIMKVLNNKLPTFAHHSLLTGIGGEQLSKRFNSLSIKELKEEGVEPESIISFLSSLGSSKSTVKFFEKNDIIKNFKLKDFGSAPTKFDKDILVLLSSKTLSNKEFHSIDELDELKIPENTKEKFWEMAKENLKTRKDIKYLWDLCLNGTTPLIDPNDEYFIKECFSIVPSNPRNEDSWSHWVKEINIKTGRKGKDIYLPLRKALTGSEKGPDMKKLFPLLQVLPKFD